MEDGLHLKMPCNVAGAFKKKKDETRGKTAASSSMALERLHRKGDHLSQALMCEQSKSKGECI